MNSAYHSLRDKYPVELLRLATEDCYGREFLDYKMAIKTVNSSRKHWHISGSTVPNIANASLRTTRHVPNGSVGKWTLLVYTSMRRPLSPTAHNSGSVPRSASAQKLHARGPMALEEITTYKWIVEGSGQTRP